MRKLTKRVLAVLLSLAMTVGLIFPNPIQAKAADVGAIQVTVKDDKDDAVSGATFAVTNNSTVEAESAKVYSFTESSTQPGLYTNDQETNADTKLSIVVSAAGHENSTFDISGVGDEQINVTLERSVAQFTVDATDLYSKIESKYGKKASAGFTFTVKIQGKEEVLATLSDSTRQYTGSGKIGDIISISPTSDWTYLKSDGFSDIPLLELTSGTNTSSITFAQFNISGFKEGALNSVFTFNPPIVAAESGFEQQIAVTDLTGWNWKDIQFSSSNSEVVSVTQDATDKSKATLIASKDGTATVSAAVTIGEGTEAVTAPVSTNITVTRSDDAKLQVAMSIPADGNYDWKTPVTFVITGTPAAAFAGHNVSVNFASGSEIVYTADPAPTFDAEGKATLGPINPKDDLHLTGTKTFTVSATIGNFYSVVDGKTIYYQGTAASYNYNPKKAQQDDLVENSELKKTVVNYGAKDSDAPDAFKDGTKIGKVTNTTSITDIPEGEAKYTIVAENPDQNQYFYIEDDGTIWFNPHVGVGNYSFTVTKKGGNNYDDKESAQLSITVSPYEISASNLPSFTATNKVYDGTTAIEVANATLINLPYGDSVVLRAVDAKTADANAADGKNVSFTFALNDSSQTNYSLPASLSGSTTVNITKRPLYIVIGNATVQWTQAGSIDAVNTASPISLGVQPFDETGKSGLIEADAALANNIQYPTLTLDSTVDGAPVRDEAYPNAIKVADETVVSPGEALANYQFAYTVDGTTKYVKGSLTITAETVADPYDYLRIDNSASTNVYQNQVAESADFKKVYKGKNAKAFFTIQNGNYDTVEYKQGENFVPVPATGLDMTTVGNEVTFRLKKGSHETASFTINFFVDEDKPDISITINKNESVISSFEKAVTFNLFNNMKVEKEITAAIEVADLKDSTASGIKSWQYVVVNAVNKDGQSADVNFSQADLDETTFNSYQIDDVTKFSGLTWTTGDLATLKANPYIDRLSGDKAEAGNYIVFVLATDYVGNSVLVSSKGTIIDDIDMTTVAIAYAPDNHKNKADFFSEDVTLDVTVTESTSGIYSGVSVVYAYITQDDDPMKEQCLVNSDPNMVDPDAENSKNYDLTTIKDKFGQITAPLTVAAQEGSKAVKVGIKTTDYAGNTIYGNKEFVIDPVAPEMEMEVSSSASRLNGKYYKADVTVTTTITERYLDLANDLEFTINGTNKKFGELKVGDFGISAIKVVKQTDESADDQQTIIEITFATDDNYNVSANVKDKAGNKGEAKVDEFVVDKTAPSVTITYYGYGDGSTFTPGTTEAARTYLNADYSSFKAVIAVIETNFSDGKTVNANYKVTAVDSEGKEVSGIDVKDVTALTSWDSKKFTADYAVDANYTFEFAYTDLAGNEATVNVNPTYITLDKVVPEGTVTVSNMVNGDASKTWDALVSAITFGLFGKDSITASMTSKDATAGVATTQYLATSELLSKAALAARTDWTDYKSAIALAANENVIVYEKVTDKAGNVEFYSSENIVVDNTDPAPEVTIVPTVPAWNKGVYAATDKPGFDIIVTDPIKNGAYSGLQTITYKITAGSVEETGELASYTKGSHTQEFKGHVDIDPEKFYSNDVQVTVTASDFSTNEATSETKTLKIDSKAPVVSFSFDTSDAQNGKYYNKEKTLTITVDERNFDPSYEPTVTSTTGGGYSFSGWTTNGETTTGTVTFSGDSDYTVTFDCYDLAGNKSNTENLEEFTVDMTNPVISVSYDNNNATNGNYYKSERTATITIEEHNFNSGNVSTTITAELDGESIDVPVVSEWASNGDTHTATVRYPGDGDYTFNISYVDQAGNTASEYKGDAFTVDKTNPELSISGVQDKSANNGTVAPVINASDINFNSDNLTWTLTGVNNPDVDASGLVMINATEQSATITFSNFPEGMDDIYTLTAKAVDAAGNETTKSITFSVNRDGSTYIINESTQKLIDKQITNNPQDIVITEINVDTLEFIELSYTKDGQVIKLEEGKDYTVEEAGGDGQWKQYTYTIKATAFSEEGEYSINIYSEDTATNSSTNKAKEMIIDFIVDKTAPTVAVANLEDMGRYQEEAHEFNVTVKDNAVLAKLEIYRDGELWQSIEGTDLLTPEGYLTISLPEAGQYQDIELIAYDAAGNVTEPLDYRVLVTSNGWIQFYNNKPLFGGSIAGVAAVGGVIAFLIAKRKKKEEDK